LIPRENTGYEALHVLSSADAFNHWMYSAIAPYTSGNILEIGSGLGNISNFFIQAGSSITLSDIDEFYLDHLKNKFNQNAAVNDFLNVDLQKKDFEIQYAGLKEKFDTVFLLNVLEHLEYDTLAVQNCRYLLKKNGTLIILVPAYKFLFSEMDKQLHHFRRYTIQTLSDTVSKEKMIIEKKFYFNFLGIPAWLYGKIRRFKVLPSGEMKLYNKLTPLGKLLDKLVFKKAGLSAIVVAKKTD
jgi:SAM-dependent methyltransferase